MSDDAISKAEKDARWLLTAGPVVAAVGIAATAIVPANWTPFASIVLLCGVGMAVWGTHRFGRLGAEEVTPAPPKDKNENA